MGDPGPQRRRNTSTSSFGVGRREGHDSSAFYDRFTPPEINSDGTVAEPSCVDEIWTGDARDMDGCGNIADSSVALMVTSPPYFAGKAYEEDLGSDGIPSSYIEYLQMLTDVFAECVRKLEPGGRMAVNVANLGRKPYRSLSADVIDILSNDLGLLLRGEVIWLKARGASGNCAWGSFASPANPVLRDLTERIVIASKGRFDRAEEARARAAARLPSADSISPDEFMEATTDMWEILPESARRVGHPAPFPVELPERLIGLYTYPGDLVLDPFMGVGSTAVAAVRTGRHYVGFDTDASYVVAARQRVIEEREKLVAEGEGALPPSGPDKKSRPGRASAWGSGPATGPDTSGEMTLRFDGPDDFAIEASRAGNSVGATATFQARDLGGTAASNGEISSEDFQARASREGQKAKDMAKQLLEAAGFTDIRANVKGPGGVEINFEARDSAGHRWRFDVSGAFTVTQRAGLRRTDTLWKALGKAAVLHFTEEGNPDRPRLVLLTTNLPSSGSTGAQALTAASGPGKPIWDAVEMNSGEIGTSAVSQLRKITSRG